MARIMPRRKKQILEFIKNYIDEYGYAPTLSEIAENFEVSSLSTIHEHIEYLEKNGFLKKDFNKKRDISIVDQETDEKEEMYSAGTSASLPVVGLIAAGAPIEAIEDQEMTLSVPHELVKQKNCYILKVKGDSMVESLIADGDYVIVEKRDFARDGDIIVALLEDGTATLKKFFKHKNYIRLQPANKKYKPLMVENVVVRGKVVGIIRKFQ